MLLTPTKHILQSWLRRMRVILASSSQRCRGDQILASWWRSTWAHCTDAEINLPGSHRTFDLAFCYPSARYKSSHMKGIFETWHVFQLNQAVFCLRVTSHRYSSAFTCYSKLSSCDIIGSGNFLPPLCIRTRRTIQDFSSFRKMQSKPEFRR